MKRIVVVLVALLSMLNLYDADARRSFEVGYAKMIYRSPSELGFIPILKDMNYNGFTMAYRYAMPLRNTPDCPYAIQIGVRYEFLDGKDKAAEALHREHYCAIPVLFNYYVGSPSDHILYLFAGPSVAADLSSRYRKAGKKVTPDEFAPYGYTKFDVRVCMGVEIAMSEECGLRVSYNMGLSNRRSLMDSAFHTGVTDRIKLRSDVLDVCFVYAF